MNIRVLLLILLIISSCIKMPEDNYISDLKVPFEFDWQTVEEIPVKINELSSIVNQNGDTIATIIPPGDYSLTVTKNSSLTVVKEASSVQTKAIGGEIKSAFYFPSKNAYATVMFEDLFPWKGDMDMNDIVFGLNIEFFVDNQARIRSFQINIQPRAIGSSYRTIGLAASLYGTANTNYIREITHSSNPALSGLFSVTGSGGGYSVETGNSFDVIPLTGDFRSYFKNNPELFINVRNIDPVTETENFSVYVELRSNMIFSASLLTLLQPHSPGRVNLDIFALFGDRGKEVHFKGGRPTSKFFFPYFISVNKTDFSTVDNWVWAVLSDQSIRHPQEFVKIYNAYPSFKSWAESGGSGGSGWYSPAIEDSLWTKGSF
jgi:LruC domain-containing protein